MGSSASLYNRFWADYTFSNTLVQSISDETEASSSANPPSPRKWAPPQVSFFKLNTDGSWIDIDNAGGGGVIRCDRGLWHIGFSSRFKSLGPASAELTAVKEGLLIAWERKITHLELEIDAAALKYMLENPKGYQDHHLAPIIKDIVSLLKRNWCVSLLHVKRDVNQVAHGLAEIGRIMTVPKVYHFQPPANVKEAYEKELVPVNAV